MLLIEKYEFTYEDFLNYCDSLYCYASKEILCVREESTPYILDENKKKTGDKKHDKIFKEILQNPQEMAELINNFTKHKINANELENYTENYITKDFKYKQADYEEIEEQSKKEIIKIFEESESEEEMSTIQERIGAEFRRNKRLAISEGRAEGLAEGLAQAIKQTISRMIKMNLEDDFIKQATGANKEEIQKIRNEVEK